MTMVTPPDNSALYKSAEGYRRVMAHYEASFQRMGIGYETRYVETRFGPTHVVISGNREGKVVVLWHGGNTNATVWTAWITRLAPSYRVYAIDTIGEMGQSAACRPAKNGPAYGQWATEAVAGLGLKRANMIGASNGGWLILKLGSVAPEMIGSAVLMSSAGFRPINKMFVLRFILPYIFKPPAETARRFMELLSPPDLSLDPEILELFRLMMGHFRLEQRSPPVINDEEIKRLAAPTYLMMGQYELALNPWGSMSWPSTLIR
jgi:pimeloyl-ACP methyl ester carboxylesterase